MKPAPLLSPAKACLAVAAIVLLAGTTWAAPGSSAPCPGCIAAGAAALDVTPPVGVPLAGYGSLDRRLAFPDLLDRAPYAFWLKPSRGAHDPIMARALHLESRKGGREMNVRLLWIAVDLVGVDREMVQDLRGRLEAAGRRHDAIIVSASHTHSGPGAFARSAPFEFLTLDRYVAAVREHLLAGMERAARLAEDRKVPARIGAGRGEVHRIVKSRIHGDLDHELGVLKVVGGDGRPVALLWNYAIHGTALGATNLSLSGDVMGEASRALEAALGVPALYTNGAVADVSPSRRGWGGVREIGAALAQGVRSVWEKTPLERSSGLRVVAEPLLLPEPRLSLRNCAGRLFPRWATVGLSSLMPRSSEMVGVAIGDSAWVTVPGELQTSLGQAIKAGGRGRFSLVFVAGLSNDYLGYFLSPEEYRQGARYIGCSALYGEGGGRLLADMAVEIFRKLRPDQRQRVGAPGRR
jgi:hypothetical protein